MEVKGKKIFGCTSKSGMNQRRLSMLIERGRKKVKEFFMWIVYSSDDENKSTSDYEIREDESSNLSHDGSTGWASVYFWHFQFLSLYRLTVVMD